MSQPTGVPSSLVPEWLDNLAALGWRVLAVAALAVVRWFLATLLWTVTASIAVAIIVSAVFAPFVLRLRARGRSRTAAAHRLGHGHPGHRRRAAPARARLPPVRRQELVAAIDAGLGQLQAQLADAAGPRRVADAAQDAIRRCSDGAGQTGAASSPPRRRA